MLLLRHLPAILILPVFLFVLTNAVGQQQPEIIVSTKYGKLRGFVHSPRDAVRKIDVFFGIPYATAPLDELRFEFPLAPSKWTDVRDAGEAAKPPACPPHARPDPQEHLNFNEDCLYLNVFAPHREPNDGSLSPVLFVIHGGAFELGSSASYFNYDLLGARFVSKGIVFVSINYRLGVFGRFIRPELVGPQQMLDPNCVHFLGFATTGKRQFPGNFGIRDQIAALEYVKENIRAFGGNPHKITVLGFSAGSGSTGLLSTIPMAAELFHQTIRMSGGILSGSGSGTFVSNTTKELAHALNCSLPTRIKKCLQQKNIEEFFDGIDKIGPAPISYAISKFCPNRMDHQLFPLDHLEAIEKLPPKRTMLGFTELDFLAFTQILDRNSSYNMLALTDEQMANYDQTHFEAFLRNYVAKSEYFGDQSAAIRADLLDFYANKYEPIEDAKKDATFYLRLYSMVCSDLMYIVPLLWEAQIRIGRAKWPIYLYEYKYANADIFPKRVKTHAAFHGNDHSLLFGTKKILNGQDKKISNFLIDSVVNFVKNGDPSSHLAKWEISPAFSLTETKSLSHMEIGVNPVQKQGMEGELKRLHFWMEMRQKYGDKFDLVRVIYGNAISANYGLREIHV